jgi:antitoxin component YwqK of YwqJK toxin-antitoxin module
VEWYDNGKLKNYCYSSSDWDSFIAEYYESGRIKKLSKEDKGCLSSEIVFYENGQPLMQTYYDSIKKKSLLYYENGRVKEERNIFFHRKYMDCHHTEFILIGDYRQYYDTGILKIKGRYKDFSGKEAPAKLHWFTGVKVGKWSYYSSSGKLESTEEYNDSGEILRKK